MIRKHGLKILVLMSFSLFFLSGCDNNKEVSGEVETEDTKTIFDRVIMGTNAVEESDLYLITDDITDDNYVIKAVSPMGSDNLVVAYSDKDTLVLKIYDIEDGNIISDSEFDLNTGEKLSFIEKCNDSYIGIRDEDNDVIYIFDDNLKLMYSADIEQNCTSLLVCPDYGRIFYTLTDDSNLYSYIPDSEVSAVWFSPDEQFDDFKIIDMAADNNTLVVSYDQNGHKLYSTISIEEQEFTTLDIADCNIQVAGNDYIVYYPGEDNFVNVFNKSVPRVVTTFSLDSSEELNNIKAFAGGPYIMTSSQNDEGYLCRFYDVQEGILANSVILSSEINVSSDTSLFDDGQTAVIILNGIDSTDFYLWDLSVNDDVLQENASEYYFGE